MNADGLPTTEDEIVWPTDGEAASALAAFARLVEAHYGERLKGLYLFGSRARGDHRPMSDADVAVVLADGDWVEWRERSDLIGLAYGPSLESGLLIQPWPVAASVWRGGSMNEPSFVRTGRRDARALDRRL